MNDCTHERTQEISRNTVDCGISGTITWTRHVCSDCGFVWIERHVEKPFALATQPVTLSAQKNKRKNKKK